MAAAGTPVVFVHGLWLHADSWGDWAELFRAEGYVPMAPGWPGEPGTVDEARKQPDLVAGKGIDDVVEHYAEIIRGLDVKPIAVGHSFGGLLAQILAGRGLAAASVAIDPAPFRGVLPLPISALRAAAPVISNPVNWGRAIPLTYDQFRYAFANAVDEQEAAELHARFAVPGSGVPLFQAAAANLNPWTEAKVNTANPGRGPLLIVSGEKDNTVPWSLANAAYKKQKRNPGVTEIVEMPGRGHSLTIDSGWREVADTALAFVRRFVPA